MVKKTRVLLVDDSIEFLNSAERFLSTIPELDIVGKAASGREALRCVSELRPDLVLMDLVMPEMNGLEATRQIKAQSDAPRTVIVTIHNHPEYRIAAEAVGADGFITKSELGEKLLPLIRSLGDSSSVRETEEE